MNHTEMMGVVRKLYSQWLFKMAHKYFGLTAYNTALKSLPRILSR